MMAYRRGCRETTGPAIPSTAEALAARRPLPVSIRNAALRGMVFLDHGWDLHANALISRLTGRTLRPDFRDRKGIEAVHDHD
jgi:hypothetical protein